MRPIDLRDEAYLDKVRELGIDAPLDQIPHFRPWFNYMYEELDEAKAVRDQYALLLAGEATLDQIPAVKAWLEEAGPGMDAIRQSAGKDHLYLSIDLEQALLHHFRFTNYIANEISELMEAFRARSMYALASGELDEAVADFIACDQIFKLLFQLNANEVIDDASREAYDNNAVLYHLLQSKQLTAAQLARLAQQLAIEHNGLSSAEIYDQWERPLLIDFFERVASGEEKTPSFLLEGFFAMGGPVNDEERAGWDWMVKHELLDTDLAIAQINRRYDELVDVLKNSGDLPEAVGVLKQADRTLRKRMGRMQLVMRAYGEKRIPAGMTAKQYSEQIVDGLLALLMHPNRVLDGPFDTAEYKTRQRFAQTMLALVRYQQDQGVYPASLKDLVPKYLAQVPMDPYQNKQAIQYNAKVVEGVATLKLSCIRIDQDGEEGPIEKVLVINE